VSLGPAEGADDPACEGDRERAQSYVAVTETAVWSYDTETPDVYRPGINLKRKTICSATFINNP